MIATTFHLVRHGETIWHRDNRYAGHSDVPLTEVGRSQAEDLGRWAARQPLDLVVSSDLSRCADTARPAAGALGLDLTTDPRLREVDFGEAEGLTREEMAVRFPHRLEEFLSCPASNPLPGAETGEAAVRRGIEALAAIQRALPGGEVLVVGHSTLFRLMLCRLLGIPLDEYRRALPSWKNGAITTVRTAEIRAPDDPGSAAALLAFNVPAHTGEPG